MKTKVQRGKHLMYFFFFMGLVIIFSFGCKKINYGEGAPIVTTKFDTSFYTGAVLEGNVTDSGGSAVTTRGICWSLNNDPTVEDGKTTDGSGLGSFVDTLTGLSANTTYYARAYAVNSTDTGYGDGVVFKTQEKISVAPVVTTRFDTSFYARAAIVGNVADNGGSTVIARGICWSSNNDPTLNDSKTTDGNNGLGSFVDTLTGLSTNTAYYARAYAINSSDTGYGDVVAFKTLGTISDADGNIYDVIAIGSQLWMKENLKVTRFNDRSDIAPVTSDSDWIKLVTPAYCWYNNESSNKDPYGAMYNWYAVNTKKLCPAGWHVPTDEDWNQLTDFLGGLTAASAKLMETGTSHWTGPNSLATNESHFTAVPGGYRSGVYGKFFSMGQNTTWWSSTSLDSNKASARAIINYSDSANRVLLITDIKQYGHSVRCVKEVK